MIALTLLLLGLTSGVRTSSLQKQPLIIESSCFVAPLVNSFLNLFFFTLLCVGTIPFLIWYNPVACFNQLNKLRRYVLVNNIFRKYNPAVVRFTQFSMEIVRTIGALKDTNLRIAWFRLVSFMENYYYPVVAKIRTSPFITISVIISSVLCACKIIFLVYECICELISGNRPRFTINTLSLVFSRFAATTLLTNSLFFMYKLIYGSSLETKLWAMVCHFVTLLFIIAL